MGTAFGELGATPSPLWAESGCSQKFVRALPKGPGSGRWFCGLAAPEASKPLGRDVHGMYRPGNDLAVRLGGNMFGVGSAVASWCARPFNLQRISIQSDDRDALVMRIIGCTAGYFGYFLHSAPDLTLAVRKDGARMPVEFAAVLFSGGIRTAKGHRGGLCAMNSRQEGHLRPRPVCS